MAKIYTRTGDQGESSLFGGKRRPKSDPRFHAYGTIDELNSAMGLILSECGAQPKWESIVPILIRIQGELFVAGGLLACGDPKLLSTLPKLSDSAITQLESEIDQWEGSLEPLKNFILPGGSIVASYTHLARAVCRRAERWTLDVVGSGDEVFDPYVLKVLKYLNRLSDHLFTLGRWFNKQDQIPDVLWKPS